MGGWIRKTRRPDRCQNKPELETLEGRTFLSATPRFHKSQHFQHQQQLQQHVQHTRAHRFAPHHSGNPLQQSHQIQQARRPASRRSTHHHLLEG